MKISSTARCCFLISRVPRCYKVKVPLRISLVCAHCPILANSNQWVEMGIQGSDRMHIPIVKENFRFSFGINVPRWLVNAGSNNLLRLTISCLEKTWSAYWAIFSVRISKSSAVILLQLALGDPDFSMLPSFSDRHSSSPILRLRNQLPPSSRYSGTKWTFWRYTLILLSYSRLPCFEGASFS